MTAYVQADLAVGVSAERRTYTSDEEGVVKEGEEEERKLLSASGGLQERRGVMKISKSKI